MKTICSCLFSNNLNKVRVYSECKYSRNADLKSFKETLIISFTYFKAYVSFG